LRFIKISFSLKIDEKVNGNNSIKCCLSRNGFMKLFFYGIKIFAIIGRRRMIIGKIGLLPKKLQLSVWEKEIP
jgi:hypothetical protein